MANTAQPPPSPEALRQGYEPSALRVRGLLVFAACFVVAGAAVFVLVWLLLRFLLGQDRAADAAASSVTALQPQQHVVPLLQPSGRWHDTLPAEDLKAMRERENSVFSHLGWRAQGADVTAGMPEELVAAVEARMKASKDAVSAATQPATREGARP